MQIRVYYEDTDVGGVVYYANYLKFCERARSEKFFKNDLSPVDIDGHFVVKKLEANYISSAKLGDILEINSKLLKLSNVSFILFQEVFKEDKKLFEMTITLAYVSFDGKLQKLSNEKKELIKRLFGENK